MSSSWATSAARHPQRLPPRRDRPIRGGAARKGSAAATGPLASRRPGTLRMYHVGESWPPNGYLRIPNQRGSFSMADSMTVLRNAGPPGTKRNIAILGDGFTAADQDAYNHWVEMILIEGVFGNDYYSEDASAYNIYRVNLESVDS